MPESSKRAGVTQADVARVAGVSQAMVSYVLTANTRVTIPEETKQRILNAIESLGYVPNRAAQSLRTSKTYAIGCVIPDITNPFYPEFVRGVQEVVDQNGYDFVLYSTGAMYAGEARAIRSLLQGRIDGVVGVFFDSSANDLAVLARQEIPVVRLEASAKPPGKLAIDNLYVDNLLAARAAVNYLVEKGHRRIAMIAGDSGPGNLRREGYRNALAEHHLPVDERFVQTDAFTIEGGVHAMNRLLDLSERPDAVFAADDLIAIGAIKACHERGIQIPDEIAVMGFDNIAFGRVARPALTTVSQFQDRLGREAARLLFERLEGSVPPEGRSVVMPFELVLRESA